MSPHWIGYVEDELNMFQIIDFIIFAFASICSKSNRSAINVAKRPNKWQGKVIFIKNFIILWDFAV